VRKTRRRSLDPQWTTMIRSGNNVSARTFVAADQMVGGVD
jgi:hypothetical protein